MGTDKLLVIILAGMLFGVVARWLGWHLTILAISTGLILGLTLGAVR